MSERSARALDPSRSLFQYNCQTWRRANGLPANGITAIAQTADGRLWLGTSKGLICFDGVEFEKARQPAGFQDLMITSLACRSNGGLWYGLERGGFGWFDGEAFFPARRPEWTQASVNIHTVVEARDGTMLLAGNALAGRLKDFDTLDSMLPVKNADVFSVYEDPRGRIWMGTAEHGLFYWQDGKLTAFPDKTLRNAVVSSVAMDSASNLWVGLANGLRCFGPNFQNVPLPDGTSQPLALLVDSHGVVWIGSFGTGLWRYHHGRMTSLRKADGLASDRILSLAESKDGSLWIGTSDGLSELSDVKFPTISVTEGLAADSCLAVAASPAGGVWAGTPNGVTLYRDGRCVNFGQGEADGFRSRWAKRLFVARNGDLYCMGAHKNLDRFSVDHVVYSWTNTVWPRAVAEDSRGILVAMAGDLMRIQGDRMVPFQLADGRKVSLNWINDVRVARDDSIWIAADEGLFQIQQGKLQNWLRSNGLPGNRFNYLCEGDEGEIWATTQSAGLARFRDGKVRMLTREQGLPEDFVFSIVRDKAGGFWMDSNRGIFHVLQQELNAVADGTNARVQVTVYDGQDAVKTTDKTAQEYSGCCSTDGKIWFPSSKGLIEIDPAHVRSNPEPPAVFIRQVRINGQECALDREPKVGPGPGNLQFDYSALDYVAPLKIQYRYRLDGFESDWVEAGSRRSAFYTNLKPGRYRFLVQACNADGIWNATGPTFALNLPRPFYETAGFRAGCLVFALGLGAGMWRVWHLRRRQVQLQEANIFMETKVQERTSELAEANQALRREIDERKRIQAESEQLHEQLLDVSHQAGQAEVASNVLHNVGNVLNSVNISTSLVADRLRQLPVVNLTRMGDLIEQHRGDLDQFLTKTDQGKQVSGYLKTFGHFLEAERTELLDELRSLGDNLEHIKEIVAMQQSYARTVGLFEQVNLVELVEGAVKIQSSGLSRRSIEVHRQYESVPPVMLDKRKVLQILVNLFQNAKQACDEAGRDDKQITVSIGRFGPDRLHVCVADNGVGIAPTNLTRIFAHGFTTRKDGHGFGLHSSALAAKELGGALSVRSEGEGKGAVFTLELPLSPPDSESEPGADAASAGAQFRGATPCSDSSGS